MTLVTSVFVNVTSYCDMIQWHQYLDHQTLTVWWWWRDDEVDLCQSVCVHQDKPLSIKHGPSTVTQHSREFWETENNESPSGNKEWPWVTSDPWQGLVNEHCVVKRRPIRTLTWTVGADSAHLSSPYLHRPTKGWQEVQEVRWDAAVGLHVSQNLQKDRQVRDRGRSGRETDRQKGGGEEDVLIDRQVRQTAVYDLSSWQRDRWDRQVSMTSGANRETGETDRWVWPQQLSSVLLSCRRQRQSHSFWTAADPNVSDPSRNLEEMSPETPAEPGHHWYLDPIERHVRQTGR